jgi:5-formyltetrahydrofolate cyclo-ligase
MVGDVSMGDGADVDVAKRLLRAEMRAVRAGIAADVDWRQRRSRSICERVIDELRPRPLTHVMLFRALPTEPDVDGVARWCSSQGIGVHEPEVDGDLLRVMPGDLDPALLDAVIVPGLAFTADGHRLGQGGGHFDRFLVRLGDDCLRIGVAFREQLVDVLPVAPHDATVHLVITA